MAGAGGGILETCIIRRSRPVLSQCQILLALLLLLASAAAVAAQEQQQQPLHHATMPSALWSSSTTSPSRGTSSSAMAAALASLLLTSTPALTAAAAVQGQAQVDLNWYPPSATQINNLTAALDPSNAAYGFIYNSSAVPAGVKYGTYNWCNMPHARKTEYVIPGDGVKGGWKLKYVEVMQRHHKRTPYASNSFPVEPYPWNCDDQGLFYYGAPFGGPPTYSRPPRGSSLRAPAPGPGPGGPPTSSAEEPARAFWKITQSPINPFTPKGWQGSCSFPQITSGGLDDSFVHGKDLFGVYHDLLGFLPADLNVGPGQSPRVGFRVTNNVITSQVAGMFIAGMYSSLSAQRVPLTIQAAGIDSLEPQYSCPKASSLFGNITSPSSNARWAEHLSRAQPLYKQLDAISGVDPNNDGGFHVSMDHYFDNLSARQCHAKPFPCKILSGGGQSTDPSQCVSQDQADAVYRLGQWEYSHIYRDAGPETLAASAASLGVWIAEFASHLRAKIAGDEGGMLYLHNFAHDGSTSRLLSVLQVDRMVWPGMGTEIVFELWQKVKHGSWHVRVLFGGQVLKSSNPSLGVMDMLPAETLLAYFDGLVGKNASLVRNKCGA